LDIGGEEKVKPYPIFLFLLAREGEEEIPLKTLKRQSRKTLRKKRPKAIFREGRGKSLFHKNVAEKIEDNF